MSLLLRQDLNCPWSSATTPPHLSLFQPPCSAAMCESLRIIACIQVTTRKGKSSGYQMHKIYAIPQSTILDVIDYFGNKNTPSYAHLSNYFTPQEALSAMMPNIRDAQITPGTPSLKPEHS